MKYLLSVIILIAATCCYGQKISGIVTDKANNRPVSGALVSLGSSKIYTNVYGNFEIANDYQGDSLKVTHIGFKRFAIFVNKATTMLHIELEPAVISLHVVTIHGDKDFKRDSMNNRADFAKQFNYKSPKLSDAFIWNPNVGADQLISVDPFTLIAALTKKSAPEYKFKKLLITDEHEEYVTRKFNKGLVSRITGLKGDTLSEFLTRYRPSYQFALKAADYDIEIYIRENFERFKKAGFPVSNPFSDTSAKGPVKLTQ